MASGAMASGRTNRRVLAGEQKSVKKASKRVQKQPKRGLTPSSPESGPSRDCILRKRNAKLTLPKGAGKVAVAEGTKAATSLANLQAVLVNLDRRSDRLVECSQRFSAHCSWLPYRRMRASDGKIDDIPSSEVAHSWHTGRNTVYQKLRSVRKGWDDLHTHQVRELTLSAGERGCASSHIRAWRECLENCKQGVEEPLVVFEDDADPTENFTEVLSRALAALPRDADVLYLGYSQAADWRRELTPELVEAEYVWTTVAYVVWPSGARKFLSQLPVNQPVDNWMATLCADNEIKAYAVTPKIVRQADGWNVKSDVGHSDEVPPAGAPASDVFHTDDKYWGNGPANPNFKSCPLGPADSDILKSDDRYWG